ncbi:MAG: hypothetical protein U0797_24990 [Gemmataceae bacterium]
MWSPARGVRAAASLLLGLDREEITGVFGRVAADEAQEPAVRGAAIGARWSLGAADADHVREQLCRFVDPDRLGDFTGLFALAREQVRRREPDPGHPRGHHRLVPG